MVADGCCLKLRDFLLLVLICLVWGYSNVLSKVVVGTWAIPPLFFAAVRFAVVVAVTIPWLLPMPRPAWRIVVIALLMGAGNFALLFIGLRTSTPSAAAVVLQIGVPFTTLLSVVVLGERIRWRRGLGIALTLSGVLVVVWNPAGLVLSTGLWFIIGAAFTGSLGAVLMKQVEDVAPLRFQAWVGLVSFLPLAIASAAFEHGQWASAAAIGWPFVAAVLFAALVVSVLGHTSYYGLIRRYDANLLAPLTLMTPIFTIAFGVWLTGDRLDARMVVGTLVALMGVLVIALRSGPRSALLAEREQA